MANRFDRIKIEDRGGYNVLDLGAVDIWDGADLSLLRESLTILIADQGCTAVGVDLSHVKYIPSGFFGMLFDWRERGVDIRLYHPQPNVAAMIWFRQFAEPMGGGVYDLVGENRIELPPEGQPGYREPDEDEFFPAATLAR
ncbi:MAG: STAS domain-containing protein [Planctomycetota bacterium]